MTWTKKPPVNINLQLSVFHFPVFVDIEFSRFVGITSQIL